MFRKISIYLFIISIFSLTGNAGYSQAPVIQCVGALPFTNTIQILGVNFTGATSVTINGGPVSAVNSFTVVDDHSINASLSDPLFAGPVYILTVTSPAGSMSFPFSITPEIDHFTPSSSIGPGDTLILYFQGPVFNTMAQLNGCNGSMGIPLGQGFDSLKILVQKGCQNDPYNMFVLLQNYSNCFSFARQLPGLSFNAIPVITSVTPLTAKKGDTIKITGKYLYTDNVLPVVKFGGAGAGSVIVVAGNSTEIKAVVGDGADGDVTVTNSYNVSGIYPGFSYQTFICPNGNGSFTSNLIGASYQWQMTTMSAGVFVNISNNTNYAGVNSPTLSLTNIPSGFYGYQYRCMVDGVASNISYLKIGETFTGAIDQTWEKSGNWSCGVVPDANTDATIHSDTVTVNSNATCRSLTVTAGAKVTVNAGANLKTTH